MTVPGNWQNFLRSDDNKRELFTFLALHIKSTHIEGKLLVSLYAEALNLLIKMVCHHVTMGRLTPEYLSMYAANSGHGRAMIRTVDTDIVVLAVSNMQNVRELWLTFGTRKFFRYIPCHSIANQFNKTTSNALTFFNAFTGCVSFCLFGSWQKDCIGDMESIFCCDSSIIQALEKTLR